VLSAVGVASIVIALMILLLNWMLRMNADESGDAPRRMRRVSTSGVRALARRLSF